MILTIKHNRRRRQPWPPACGLIVETKSPRERARDEKRARARAIPKRTVWDERFQQGEKK
jgi:hypothetical protein